MGAHGYTGRRSAAKASMAITDTKATRTFTIRDQRIGVSLPVSMWSLYAALGDKAPSMQSLFTDWTEATPLDRRTQYGFTAYLMSAIPVLASDTLTQARTKTEAPPMERSHIVPGDPVYPTLLIEIVESIETVAGDCWKTVNLKMRGDRTAIPYSTFVYKVTRHENRNIPGEHIGSVVHSHVLMYEYEDHYAANGVHVQLHTNMPPNLAVVANKFAVLFPDCHIEICHASDKLTAEPLRLRNNRELEPT